MLSVLSSAIGVKFWGVDSPGHGNEVWWPGPAWEHWIPFHCSQQEYSSASWENEAM